MSELPPELPMPESDEQMDAMLLVFSLHEYHEAAKDIDFRNLTTAVRARKLGLEVDARVLVTPHFGGHRTLPDTCQEYDEMVWIAKDNLARRGIRAIIARIPIVYEGEPEEEVGSPSTGHELVKNENGADSNDIFMEITYGNHRSSLWLLINGHGIVAYSHKKDLARLPASDRNNIGGQYDRPKTDMYRVIKKDNSILPALTPDELRALLRESELRRR